MTTRLGHLRRLEFEARIFVSFGLVAIVVVLSEIVFADSISTASHIGPWIGMDADEASHAGFLVAAAILIVATILRMWAGSVLTSTRVMAFGVQNDALLTRGPYRLSRNPIYLADLVALAGFSLVLKPVGLVLPVLFVLHYRQLIAHEETALRSRFGARYDAYRASAPRLLPTPASLARATAALREFELTRDGVRHNALYVLFLPGLVLASITGVFWHALVIGLPGAFDWAVVHTRIGFPRRSSGRATR